MDHLSSDDDNKTLSTILPLRRASKDKNPISFDLNAPTFPAVPPGFSPIPSRIRPSEQSLSVDNVSKFAESSFSVGEGVKLKRRKTGVATPSFLSGPGSSSNVSSCLPKKKRPCFQAPQTFSSLFVSRASYTCSSSIKRRFILAERLLDLESYRKKSGVLDSIFGSNLGSTIVSVSSFSPSIVQEFYCNLNADVFDSSSSSYGRVFVRGAFHHFSPKWLNRLLEIPNGPFATDSLDLDIVISELTGGSITAWPNRKDFPAASLNRFYGILHKIALFNWMPSKHSAGVKKSLAELLYRIGRRDSINFGQIVFNSVAAIFNSKGSTSSLIFPATIFKLILSQDGFIADADRLQSITVMRLFDKTVSREPRSASGVATPSVPDDSSATIRALQNEVSNLKCLVTKLMDAVFGNQGGDNVSEGDANMTDSEEDF